MTMQPEQRTYAIVSAAFSEISVAEAAMTELRLAGFERVEISTADMGRDAHDASAALSAQEDAAAFFDSHETGASSFADELTTLGFTHGDADDLIDTMTSGGAIVTADSSNDPERAVMIFTRHFGDVRYAAGAAIAAGSESHDVLKLRAERFAIDKHVVRHGEARVRKEVVTHMQSIEVPVNREELIIEQVAFNDDGSEAQIEPGDVVRIPLSEEQVTISKVTAVTEDIRIGKRLVEETKHISETTREERLNISDGSQSTDGPA